MGRRALRIKDPLLELDSYLKTLDELSNPWENTGLWDSANPVEIEVGSGKGMFLVRVATENPDFNFLGVEVAAKYARFTASRLARAKLSNACVIHGDAQRLFAEFISSASVRSVHVYFPDPWWKKRHRNRRVMNERFLMDIQRVLMDGGQLNFWTDVAEYFQTTIALIQRVTQLVGPHEVVESVPQHDLDYRTHFERRMRLQGEPVYRSSFEKVATV